MTGKAVFYILHLMLFIVVMTFSFVIGTMEGKRVCTEEYLSKPYLGVPR